MSKFIELEKGTITEKGREYDYVVEFSSDLLKKKSGNARIRIIEERPIIEKIRTRYDPDITLYGDKNSSMQISLGYDLNEIKRTLKYLIFILVLPLASAGIACLIFTIPKNSIPKWVAWLLLLFFVIGYIKCYYPLIMCSLANYLKARNIKKMLAKEGFKQGE